MLKADIRVSGDQDMGIRELGYQEQKQNLISRYPDNHCLIIRYPDILRMIFIICTLSFGINDAYALNLDKIKSSFLNGDYKSAILEGEKIIADTEGDSKKVDELYYLLGLSYLKDGNYLRASDIFEIILKEFKGSAFKEEAKLGLADSYFLKGDFDRAKAHYQELISNPRTKFKAPIFYRLSQLGYKLGDTQTAKEYLVKLKENFPLSLELRINEDLYSIYYTVQVGSFLTKINAQNITEKLIQEDYPAYIEEVRAQDKTIYRVRVGKFRLRQEAVALQDKLSQDGYPTKLCP